jgi:hypothetical protein
MCANAKTKNAEHTTPALIERKRYHVSRCNPGRSACKNWKPKILRPLKVEAISI